MRKKIILTILVGSVLTFFIYKIFYHEDMNIMTLGDGVGTGLTAYNVKGYSYNDYLKDYYEKNSILKEYITEFSNAEETTETLILKLQNNYTLESTGLSITQAISKAKILTVSIGMNELSHKMEIETKEIETYINNIEKIFKLLRIYNKKEIFLTSLYETSFLNNTKVTEINNRLKQLCDTYQVHYIDITDILKNKEYIFNNTSFYFNYRGHRYISEEILKHL
ncbi:TPA: hypothetical protein IAB29_04970 [Candidatus Ventrenecus stercoripullorum]|nr:hypothetical protein [Candidatus Ventrenecus stercoripullorum]